MSHSSEDSNLCETGHRMEVILHEGQCWFRAADVTRWLRYRNGNQVVIKWVKSKDKTTKEFLVEGGGHSTFINENGLRGLLKRCQRPEADDLQVWVASEMDNLRTSFSRCQLKSLIVHLTPRPPSDPQDDVTPDSLYIMVNSLIPGLVKVGRSAFPDRRAKQLSAGQPVQVIVKRSYSTKGFLERIIHQKLATCRVTGGAGMEWFKISVKQAALLIEATILEDELANPQGSSLTSFG
jgi:hypothetical protein